MIKKLIALPIKSNTDNVKETLNNVLEALGKGKEIKRMVIITESVCPDNIEMFDYEICTSNITYEGIFWLLEMGKQQLLAESTSEEH